MLPLQQHIAISELFLMGFLRVGDNRDDAVCHPVVIDDGYCSADDENFVALAIEG